MVRPLPALAPGARISAGPEGVRYLARMLLSEVDPALGALGPPPPYPAAPRDPSRFRTAAFAAFA